MHRPFDAKLQTRLPSSRHRHEMPKEQISRRHVRHLSDAHSDMQTTLVLLCSLSEVRMLLTGEPCLLILPVSPAPRPLVTGAT